MAKTKHWLLHVIVHRPTNLLFSFKSSKTHSHIPYVINFKKESHIIHSSVQTAVHAMICVLFIKYNLVWNLLFELCSLTVLCEKQKLWRFSLCNFLQSCYLTSSNIIFSSLFSDTLFTYVRISPHKLRSDICSCTHVTHLVPKGRGNINNDVLNENIIFRIESSLNSITNHHH